MAPDTAQQRSVNEALDSRWAAPIEVSVDESQQLGLQYLGVWFWRTRTGDIGVESAAEAGRMQMDCPLSSLVGIGGGFPTFQGKNELLERQSVELKFPHSCPLSLPDTVCWICESIKD